MHLMHTRKQYTKKKLLWQKLHIKQALLHNLTKNSISFLSQMFNYSKILQDTTKQKNILIKIQTLMLNIKKKDYT